MKKTFLGIGAITIIAVLGYMGFRYYHGKQLLREAEVYSNTGKLKEAEEKYMEYLLAHPENLEVWLRLAGCLSDQDKFSNALDVAKHVEKEIEGDVSKKKMNDWVNYFLALIYLKESDRWLESQWTLDSGKKMLKKAEEYMLKEAAHKEVLIPWFWYLQARRDMFDNKPDEALAKFLKLKKEYPDYEPSNVNNYIREIKNNKLEELQAEAKKTRQTDIVHVGDSKEKVRSILGNPDSINKAEYFGTENWHYSYNSITFKRGYVSEASGIKIDPFPRKVKSLRSPKVSEPKPRDIVHMGDTADRVKAILGNPKSTSKVLFMDYWWYGRGYIEFSNGRVIGANGIKIDRSPRKEVQ